MVNGWECLENVIAWSGLTVNAFALKIGLKRSENLYRIFRNKVGISKKLAELITSAYPEISIGWLLTGEGEMLKPAPNNAFPISQNDLSNFNPSSCFPILSHKNGNAVMVFDSSTITAVMPDNSMEPLIPKHAYVFMKRRLSDNIVSGRVYSVVTRNFTGIRMIKRQGETDKLILEPVNKCYSEITLRKSDIKNIYLAYSIFVKV